MMLQAREALMAQFRPYLVEQGLTDQQWRIVRALYDSGELEPRQLGECCQISSPSITGVLARMEEMGLIARHPVPGDRRRLRVSLTAHGKRIAKRIAPKVEAKYEELESLLGVETMHRAYDVLDGLLARLRESGTPAAAEQPSRRARGGQET